MLTLIVKRLNILVLASFGLFFGLLALHYGQDYTWDGRNYHFYNGYAFINQRLNWDFAPAMVQSYLNPFFDVINYLLVTTQSAKMVSFIHGVLSGVTLFLVFLIAKSIFQDTPSKWSYIFFSVLISATSTDNIALLGLITNDTKSAFLTIISVYFTLKSFEAKQDLNLFLGGLSIGLSTAFKLTAACYGIASFIALVYCLLQKDLKLRNLIIFILAGTIGFIVGDGYWMYLLYKMYGSPLFPYYNNIFHSSFAPNSTYSDYLYHPHDYLIFPYLFGFFKTTTVEHLRDMRFAIVYTLLIFQISSQSRKSVIPEFIDLLLHPDATLGSVPSVASGCNRRSINSGMTTFRDRDDMKWNFLIAWFISGYLLWFFMFTIFRYALPLELLSGIVIVYLLNKLIKNEKVKPILVLICISLFATTVCTRFLRIPFHDKLYAATTPSLPQNAIVFLESTPSAYVIPFFQKDVHFVGALDIIDNNKLDAVVKNNISKIYTLKLINQPHTKNDYLKLRYGLQIDIKNCQTFTTNIGDQLQLCSTIKG